MRKEHHSFMSEWGPYSKKYMGISKIMKESTVPGARFDLVIYPTYSNSAVPVPNVTVPSGYHPWNSDNESKYFSYRYELIWKDQLYADIDLFEINNDNWGVRINYQNKTEKSQKCMLNLFAAIEYPSTVDIQAFLPKKNDFWNALDYKQYVFAKKRPWENLTHDALKKGEQKVEDFTEGNGLGETYYHLLNPYMKLKWFGGEKNDTVSYYKKINSKYRNATLTIRYKTIETQDDVLFHTNYGSINFKASNTPRLCHLNIGEVNDEIFKFDMKAVGTKGNGVLLDFFCITEQDDYESISTIIEKKNFIPEINKSDNHISYQYNYGENPITLTILNNKVRERKLYSGCIEDALITRLTNSDETYDNLTRSFSGAFMEKHSDEGFYHTNVVDEFFIAGHEEHTEWVYIGTNQENYSKKQLEEFWRDRTESSQNILNNLQGKEYEFSVRLLKSAMLSNVVYPIYRHGDNIVHYTPGKRWDTLYTWDSGFIGLGMLEYSPEKAEYIMDTYLSEEDNQDFAFVSHGSLVPTQFYLYFELLNKANKKEKEDLRKYYSVFRRYYLYIAGKTEGSTIGRLSSGMLTVYDYFYNASGMDDYPPQVAIHRDKLEEIIAPVCSSAHFIRVAKIMKQAARLYGYFEDIDEYDKDITKISTALLTNAWDEESGYFGYVLHKNDSSETQIYRTAEGENYNKGIDGITPLIAGVCTDYQKEVILQHMKSEDELWTNVGLSTVDQSASYYYENGYWNGSVWFPYQYLLWKALFDIGENLFAYQIAETALNAWKQEVEFTYNTYELIQIESERGGWFHQFSGLSTPILIWQNAYHQRGTITTGFETLIDEYSFTDNYSSSIIKYDTENLQSNQIIVVMDSQYEYNVFINGKQATVHQNVKGALEINLTVCRGEILIVKDEKIL